MAAGASPLIVCGGGMPAGFGGSPYDEPSLSLEAEYADLPLHKAAEAGVHFPVYSYLGTTNGLGKCKLEPIFGQVLEDKQPGKRLSSTFERKPSPPLCSSPPPNLAPLLKRQKGSYSPSTPTLRSAAHELYFLCPQEDEAVAISQDNSSGSSLGVVPVNNFTGCSPSLISGSTGGAEACDSFARRGSDGSSPPHPFELTENTCLGSDSSLMAVPSKNAEELSNNASSPAAVFTAGFDIKAGAPNGGPSLLEVTLRSLWDGCDEKGLFRYDVKACATRVLPGKWGFVAQLNEGRATKKRATEIVVDVVCQDFSPSKFHFGKAFVKEALLQFEPMLSDAAAATGGIEILECPLKQQQQQHPMALGLPEAAERLVISGRKGGEVEGEGETEEREGEKGGAGVIETESWERGMGNRRGMGEADLPKTAIRDASTMILINVSPIEYGHVLLVPNLIQCLPQQLTAPLILSALRFAAEVGSPDFRVGYNSLGAYATINHLHFQGYFLPHSFPCERAGTTPLHTPSGEGAVKTKGVQVSYLTNYPVLGFVVEVTPCSIPPLQADPLPLLSATLGHATAALQTANIPFNLFISASGTRVFLFPQCFAERQAQGVVPPHLLECQVNPAVFEVAGHLVLKRAEDYERAEEGWASELLGAVSLSEEKFAEVATLCFP